MANIPDDRKYAETHEWVQAQEDGSLLVGISDHAQDSLGDVVYVELPEVGSHYAHTDPIGVVESVKAASDIYAPVSGEVVAVNALLEDSPETVNEHPYEDGWFLRIMPESEDLEHLLSAEDYAEQCEKE